MSQPQPQWQPIPQPSKKGLSTGAIVAIVIGAVVVLACGICAVTGMFSTALDKATGKNRHEIVFEVSGPAKARVNWSTLEDSAVLNDEPLPWSKTVQLEDKTGLVGVIASGEGRLSCRLLVDGKVVDTEESDGVVNCSKSVGF